MFISKSFVAVSGWRLFLKKKSVFDNVEAMTCSATVFTKVCLGSKA